MANKKKKGSAKKRRRTKVIVFTVEIIVLLVVLAALYVSLKLGKIDSGDKGGIAGAQTNELTDEMRAIQDRVRSGYSTIAVFGVDNRSNGNFEYGNSDVIMVASVNNRTDEVKVASIYRDTYLNLTDGSGYGKCNSAFNKGGVMQAVSMLNVNLDLEIEQYVCVDFNAVAEAVDLLGGVEMYVTAEEAWIMAGYIDEVAALTGKPANQLPQGVDGTYTLDGAQAVAYGRIRYTAGNDFRRTERQREVLQKMLEKAKEADWKTLNALVDTVAADVKTSMSVPEILSYAKDVTKLEITETTGFPFDLSGMSINGQDDVIPLDLASNVAKLHEFLYGTPNYKVSRAVQNISNEIVGITGLSAADAQ